VSLKYIIKEYMNDGKTIHHNSNDCYADSDS
jgi:hypothetical protein